MVIVLTRNNGRVIKLMNKNDVLKKVEADEDLTAYEIRVYNSVVKPQKQVYGKYGTLAKQYLEEHQTARFWVMVANNELVDYLHGVDRQADELYETMYAKLSKAERFKKTGNFMRDLQIETEIRNLIHSEIMNELVYV